jgi:hypothetical protein
MKRSIFGAGVLAALCVLNLASPPAALAGYVTACNTYDWNHWNNAYPWGNSHNGSAYMNSSQVNLQGGWMQLHAQRWGAPSGYNFSSGTIYCKTQIVVDDQHLNWTIQGTFNADPQSGSWPAMWLCYAYGWPPESDIMEFKGNANCWQNTFQTSGQTTSHVNWVNDPLNTSHTYKIWINRVDSTYVTIDYYIDGNWKARDTADFTGKPMNLIIDLQTEGSSGTAYFNDSYLTGGSIEIGYTAPDSSGPSTGTYYYMQNRTSGLVIDSRGSTTAGSQVAQWSKVSSSNLKWQLVASDSGYYYIQNQTTGLYLDGGGSTANGSAVKEWNYVSSPNLQWQLVASDSGYYYVKNRATGLYLDGGGATASGAALKQWSYVSSYNLQWSFQ